MPRPSVVVLAGLVVLMGSVAPALAAPVAGPRFLGFHPAGGFAWRLDGDQVQVCREDTTDVPTGWPEGVALGPGVACGVVPARADGTPALTLAREDTKGAKTARKNLWGLEVKLERDAAAPDGPAAIVVVNGPDEKKKVGEAPAGAKLGDVQWRADGRAVAVTVGNTLVIAPVADLLVGGPAGRKLAERHHADGQKLYKKRDWSAAGRLFEAAIAADGEWAPARYARAAAEAQGGVGRSAMIENLEWLKARAGGNAPDAAAARKLLAGARDDDAFDAWVGEPEVRELLGLPKVSSMDVPARLLERKGTWTLQGATCKSPWLTLKLARLGKSQSGALTVVAAESCKGKKVQRTTTGTWKLSSTGAWELALKKPLADLKAGGDGGAGGSGAGFPASATFILDETYQQLKLQPPEGAALGPFEPGGARIDDSTL